MSALGITFQYVAALVALVGLVIYHASSGAKTAETGRIMFFVGLAIVLLKTSGKL